MPADRESDRGNAVFYAFGSSTVFAMLLAGRRCAPPQPVSHCRALRARPASLADVSHGFSAADPLRRSQQIRRRASTRTTTRLWNRRACFTAAKSTATSAPSSRAPTSARAAAIFWTTPTFATPTRPSWARWTWFTALPRTTIPPSRIHGTRRRLGHFRSSERLTCSRPRLPPAQ